MDGKLESKVTWRRYDDSLLTLDDRSPQLWITGVVVDKSR
jgi:hypothetical protein